MAADTETVLISRCVCRNIQFSELLPQARAADWSLTDVIQETGCGGQCGLCRPYISRMLRTGKTEFHEIITEEYP